MSGDDTAPEVVAQITLRRFSVDLTVFPHMKRYEDGTVEPLVPILTNTPDEPRNVS